MTLQPNARELCIREKLLTFGASTLSDTELLAAVISSGSGKKSCVQLALDLIQHFGDLRAVLNSDVHSFQNIAGLGIVRYVQLQAAREICRRSDLIDLKQRVSLTDTRQTTTFLKRQLRDKKNETFAGIFLDNQLRIIAYEELFSGTINSATIHPRPIIERVLRLNAAALILAHNHPSGHAKASHQDREVTERLRHSLELVDVRLLDHVVIGDNEIYSIMTNVSWVCH
jgi:DNA repair protein RadC